MKKAFVLQYREPGKRPGSSRWAKRPVDSVDEAEKFLRETPEATGPAFVMTRGNWNKNQTVAILKA